MWLTAADGTRLHAWDQRPGTLVSTLLGLTCAAWTQDVWLTAADGTKLHAWYLYPRTLPSAAARRRRPAVLFLQENAGNMALRLPFLRLLARYLDCAVLALRRAHALRVRSSSRPPCVAVARCLHCTCSHAANCMHIATHVQAAWRHGHPCDACSPDA